MSNPFPEIVKRYCSHQEHFAETKTGNVRCRSHFPWLQNGIEAIRNTLQEREVGMIKKVVMINRYELGSLVETIVKFQFERYNS